MPDKAKPLLIFDFDGTIANTIDIGIDIYNEIAPEYALDPITRDDVHELRKLNIRAALARLKINKVMAIQISTRIRREIHDRMDQVQIFPGITEAVLALHDNGFRLGILSSNSTDNIRQFIRRFDLEECFEFVEAGVSLFGKAKRIRKVLKLFDVSRKNALYIGDETRDMEAARKCRVAMLAVCWGANRREAMIAEGPAFCIEDPSELVACARRFDEHKRD